jgi:hypothetical protein
MRGVVNAAAAAALATVVLGLPVTVAIYWRMRKR